MSETARKLSVFPAFHKVDGARVVVVGGGKEAGAKVRLLAETSASIQLFSTTLDKETGADLVAAKLATVLKAEKLLMLTNISGVLDKAGKLMTELTVRRIDELMADGTISGGMIPKLAGAVDAAKSGVHAVHVIDGRVPHAMLLEILTDQAYGTMIKSH